MESSADLDELLGPLTCVAELYIRYLTPPMLRGSLYRRQRRELFWGKTNLLPAD